MIFFLRLQRYKNYANFIACDLRNAVNLSKKQFV